MGFAQIFSKNNDGSFTIIFLERRLANKGYESLPTILRPVVLPGF